MRKKFKTEEGSLTIQGFNLDDGTFDPVYAMDEVLASWETYSEDRLKIAVGSLDECRAAFVDQFESDIRFKSAPKTLQKLAAGVLSKIVIRMIENDDYLGASGCSAFHLWMISLMMEDTEKQKAIEDKLADFRTKYKV